MRNLGRSIEKRIARFGRRGDFTKRRDVLARALICHFSDFRRRLAHLNWIGPGNDYWRISSELLFWYHKIEKGLCVADPLPHFQFYSVDHIERLLGVWEERKFSLSDPIYVGALESLRGMRDYLHRARPDGFEGMIARLDQALGGRTAGNSLLSTPVAYAPSSTVSMDAFQTLCEDRRSVRFFDAEPVDLDSVRRALKAAQLSPSACNRQPWKVHLYSEAGMKEEILKLQNGNGGFRHTIPLVAIVTADLGTFFDSSERHQAFLDAGLFLMSFLLALQAQGLSSCCLNWCVMPEVDRRAHDVAKIPDSECIVTFLAIGKAADGIQVPRSPRREIEDFLVVHGAS